MAEFAGRAVLALLWGPIFLGLCPAHSAATRVWPWPGVGIDQGLLVRRLEPQRRPDRGKATVAGLDSFLRHWSRNVLGAQSSHSGISDQVIKLQRPSAAR